MKKRNIRRKIAYIPLFIVLCFVAFLMVLPIFWVVASSFKEEPEIIKYPPTFLPHSFTWANYIKANERIDLPAYIKNSIIYSVGTTIPSLFVNTLAGYAFARYNFKGKNVIFILFLATMMIPFQVIMVPLFLEVHALGMYNNYWGLIIPKIASAYWIFMMRAAFQPLPKELEEAARIDGLNEFGIYWHIMMPLVKPSLITLIVLNLNGFWNDLLWPLIVTSDTSMRTLANGLAMFVGAHTIEYGAAFAGATISIIPMLVAYLFGQKYFVAGQVNSGLKG